MADSSSSGKENSDKNLTKVTVHHCDKLKFGHLLFQPVVYMHIINSYQGSYIKKQNKNKAAVSFYETQRGDVDYIMPIMTNPCSIQQEKSQVLIWEESFVLNESLDYLVKKELSTMLFFEVVDLIPTSGTKDKYVRLNENGMKKLAWAFLKLVGSNDVINTGTKLRLQLYKPFPPQRKKKTSDIEVFQWWSKGTKTPLPASLHLSIVPHEIFAVEPALRSLLPYQEETTLSASEKLAEELKSKGQLKDSNNSTSSVSKNAIKWSRKDGEPCEVPTVKSLVLSTTRSCQILMFSSLGRILVIGSGSANQYFISFYEIPSGKFLHEKFAHSDVIYDFDWCKDDSCLLTASGDYSVKLWCSESWNLKATFVHPSFVYAAKFQPMSKSIFCTACFDHIIRIWTYNKTVQLLQELEGHNGSVNTLCWLEGKMKLISADSNGQVNVWKVPQVSKYSTNQGDNFERYVLQKKVDIPETKVTSIDKLVNSNTSDAIFMFCGDGIVRVINPFSEEILFRYKCSLKYQNSVTGCCSPCGNLFFLCYQDGIISIWNKEFRDIKSVLSESLHLFRLSYIVYHPFEHMLAVCSFEEGAPVYIYTYNKKEVLCPSDMYNENSNQNKCIVQCPTTSHRENSLMRLSKSETKDSSSVKNNLRPDLSRAEQRFHEKKSSLYSQLPKSNSHLYESDSSVSQRSLESLEKNEKSEMLTAVITPSGQFDVIAVTDSSSKSDGYGSQSSNSGPAQVMQRSSKRSQRRRKLKELNK